MITLEGSCVWPMQALRPLTSEMEEAKTSSVAAMLRESTAWDSALRLPYAQLACT